MKDILEQIISGKDLSYNQAVSLFNDMFDDKLKPSQIASVLTALRIKGETEKELSAAAFVARSKALKVKKMKSLTRPLIDTCSTGGSGVEKFNVSTAVAFVLSACGLKVAKHGNRSASSHCGSADVLEELGINISLDSSVMAKSLEQTGICFLFAPLYHKAFKSVVPVRKELKIRTLFNILGPLCNPFEVEHQLLGVCDKNLPLKMAKVLRNLRAKKAFVVWGEGVKDEVSLCGQTKVAFLNGKKISQFSLTPKSFGLKKIKLKDLEAKNPKTSAKIIRGIFKGKKSPCYDQVLASVSCVLYMLGRAKDFKQGVCLADEIIQSGKVEEKYNLFKRFLEGYE